MEIEGIGTQNSTERIKVLVKGRFCRNMDNGNQQKLRIGIKENRFVLIFLKSKAGIAIHYA